MDGLSCSVVECLIWHSALKYGNNHRHILYADITGIIHNGTSHFNVYVKRWWHMYLSVKHKFVLINNSNSKLAKNNYMNKTCISIRSIILPLTCWIDICNIYIFIDIFIIPLAFMPRVYRFRLSIHPFVCSLIQSFIRFLFACSYSLLLPTKFWLKIFQWCISH